MWAQTEPKNEHDPHRYQSPRTLPDTVSQYPNIPPSEPHRHDHQIPHVYTWQATQNGISISLHYDSCGCIRSLTYSTPQAAGNTTLRDSKIPKQAILVLFRSFEFVSDLGFRTSSVF